VKRAIRFTPPAQAQFLSAIEYIKADRPAAAVSFRNRAHEELSRLAQFPESGRIIPEYPALGFREVLVGPYRFFYKLVGDAVWIVGTWHDAQLPAEPKEPTGA
jgi:toxin ParE1/3/4